MTGIPEMFAMFIAGVITMPVIIEGYAFYQEYKINKSYRQKLENERQVHDTRMQEMVREWNDALDRYNKKLSKLQKKLRNHGLFVETDENDNEIVVKKVPVKMSFKEWLEQKKKELLRGR